MLVHGMRGVYRVPGARSLMARIMYAVVRSAGGARPARLLAALPFLVHLGCSSSLTRLGSHGWVADYDTAEQRVHKTGRELLICYLDGRRGRDAPMERVLKSEPVRALSRRYVCCTLVKSYEPDRRYVAQFGVDRTPAWILVHPDGTYHAVTGRRSVEQVTEFLAASKPPGRAPVINPYIPRKPRYDWHDSIAEAEAASRQSGRPMLVVCYRSLSRDWRTLMKLLSQPEVYLRFADLVHCRIRYSRFAPEKAVTRFGALRIPALVIAHPDGDFNTLQRPRSTESVVRFADAALTRTHAGVRGSVRKAAR